jgi:hypothetical protein
MADKPLFSNPLALSRQTKQIAIIAGLALAALAVYEFSSNAGTQAGESIGEGIGSGVEDAVLLGGAGLLLLLFL